MNADILLQHFNRISEAPDAVQRLRRFILDLAVRGKLVEQDPADEPILLSSLKKRQETISHKNHEVESPEGWVHADLGDLFRFEYGDSLPAQMRSNSGLFPVYGSNGVVGSHDSANVHGGCIVIGRKGSAGALNICNEEGCFVTDVAYSCVPPTGIDLQFTYLMFKTLGLDSLGKGVKPGLNRSEAYGLSVMIPPLAEQHRIVAKVDELMSLCDELESAYSDRENKRDRMVLSSLNAMTEVGDGIYIDQIASLTTKKLHVDKLRQAILDLAVRGKLVEQDPEDEPAEMLLEEIFVITKKRPVGVKRDHPINIPSSWRWARLGDIAIKTGSGSTPRGGKEVYKSSGVIFLRSQNIYNEGLRLTDVAFIDDETNNKMSGTKVKTGDLLLNITGGSIGRCCCVNDENIRANVSQHVAVIRLAVSEMKDFVHKVILSPYFQANIYDEQTGAGRGGLPKYKMDQISIPLPPLAEQHRIVAKVDELMTLCDKLEAEIESGTKARSMLLESVLRDALAA